MLPFIFIVNILFALYVLNETKDIDISSCELTYVLYQKLEFIPEILMIKTYVDDHTGIDNGCAVIKIHKKNTQLIGIISHIEFDDESNKYITLADYGFAGVWFLYDIYMGYKYTSKNRNL